MRPPPSRFLIECLVVTVILILATTIAFGIRRFRHLDRSGNHSDSRAAEQNQSEVLAVPLSAYTRRAKSRSIIRIEWDPTAHAVRRSPYGILYIYDGGIPNQLRLERRVLDSGSSDYAPVSDEVTFHLILPGGRPEGERLLVVLGSNGVAREPWESDRHAVTPKRRFRSAAE